MITISRDDFRKRVSGCWLGKAIGGTLGMPHEGNSNVLDLKFYDPVPKGAIPNDDLDLQVLWAQLIDRHGPFLNRIDLAQGWYEHSDFPWDEYGSASANFARKIFPPASGHHSNFCGDCMGSPIRSEIWAVLAPGDPKLACKLAYEDAILDHDGEGIWGELFMAAMESAAFVIQNREKLLEIGLSAIPKESKIARAVRSTIRWYQETGDWRKTREKILAEFGHPNFTDAAQNLAFAILGWIAGKDFGEAICIAVNCGQDTDCTGATLGALLGIVDPDGIGEEWKPPISNELVLSPNMKNMNSPATIDEFAEQTIRLAEQMIKARSEKVQFTDGPTQTTNTDIKLGVFEIDASFNSILLAVKPLKITAIYPQGFTFIPGGTIPITLEFKNESNDTIDANLEMLLPAQWTLTTQTPATLNLKTGETRQIEMVFSVPDRLRMYYEYITLRLAKNGLRQDHRLPLISAWQWDMQIDNHRQSLWLPERMLLPTDSKTLTVVPGKTITAKSKFHFPRKQRVRFILASNGSGTLSIDGKKIIDYKDAIFFPMTHRAFEETFADVDISLGLHTIEWTLTLANHPPQAALLIADAGSCLLIHDVTIATDLTQ
ncbi:MAG: ADP-ribosylglycohydrolase family protein [Phycisphaerae bacterium]|nr:ADP-ribosylglycohydrolase family protein [Phycisphaerae bacterium]